MERNMGAARSMRIRSFPSWYTKRETIILVLLFIGITAYLGHSSYSDAVKRRAALRELERGILKEKTKFKGEAGVVIRDLRTRRTIALDQDTRYPSASLVKVPIMAASFYAADEGKISFSEKIRLEKYQKVGGSGTLKSIPAGQEFTIRELIELMIIESDNTATNMLIEKLGTDFLNKTFIMLGLRHTNISRGMMEFRKRKAGIENYTTAKDIASLFEKIYRGGIIDRHTSEECLDMLKRQKMRDRIPARLPSDVAVAHKTGLERGVCHDTGIVFSPKGDFLICVLTKHRNKTSALAKKFISNIAFLVYQYYQNQ
jgi:beta-lactamase class A